MENLKEIGNLEVSFFYNGKVMGCTRKLLVPSGVDKQRATQIYERLHSKFGGRFLLDRRYDDKGYWEGDPSTYRRSNDEMTFWYDTETDVRYLRIERKGAIEYVTDVEDILYSDRPVEFLTEAVRDLTDAVYAKKLDYDFQFNYLTGILQGRTAGVDVFKIYDSGRRRRKPALAQFIADQLDGAYLTKTAKVLYNDEDDAKITEEVGYTIPTDEWATHFGLIFEDGEDNVLISDHPLFCLQGGMTADRLVQVIKTVWAKELDGYEVRIFGFHN